MFLDISRALSAPGSEFPFHLTEVISPQDILGEMVSFDQVVLSGFYSAAENSVLLHGKLTTAVHARCANCLAPAHEKLEVPFREIFIQDGDPEDPERFTFTGKSLDLSQLALSLAVLALPMRFLCQPDCKGLCPACGGNLNKNHCTCQKELPEKHPFAALQQLLTKDEEV